MGGNVEDMRAEMAKDLFFASIEFLEKCAGNRANGGRSAAAAIEHAKKEFLTTDIRDAGEPFIEEGWDQKDTTGDWIIQCDEIVNISLPLMQRYSGKHAEDRNATLQLSLTDGRRSISAIVREPIDQLLPNTAPGVKLLLHKASISRGVILLNNRNCMVLGGWSDAQIHNQQVVINYLHANGAKGLLQFMKELAQKSDDEVGGSGEGPDMGSERQDVHAEAQPMDEIDDAMLDSVFDAIDIENAHVQPTAMPSKTLKSPYTSKRLRIYGTSGKGSKQLGPTGSSGMAGKAQVIDRDVSCSSTTIYAGNRQAKGGRPRIAGEKERIRPRSAEATGPGAVELLVPKTICLCDAFKVMERGMHFRAYVTLTQIKKQMKERCIVGTIEDGTAVLEVKISDELFDSDAELEAEAKSATKGMRLNELIALKERDAKKYKEIGGNEKIRKLMVYLQHNMRGLMTLRMSDPPEVIAIAKAAEEWMVRAELERHREICANAARAGANKDTEIVLTDDDVLHDSDGNYDLFVIDDD